MKLFGKLFGLALLLTPVLIALAIYAALDAKPLLQTRAELTPEQIGRARQLFHQNDPRRLRSGSVARLSLEQADLDLALNYWANQFAGVSAALRLEQNRARIDATWPLPANPFGGYLNLRLQLRQKIGLPLIDSVRLGSLPIPGPLAELALKAALDWLPLPVDLKLVAGFVQHVQFLPQRATVYYRWQADLPHKLRRALLADAEAQILEPYQRRLAELSVKLPDRASLAVSTQALFQLAQQRSRAGDPIAENRAAILVLTLYANGIPLSKAIPQAGLWPRPYRRTLLLNGREDLTKHYLVSAMLAAYSGTPLADAVGLYKEIQDSRGGSGFSFPDLAADRAGTRMGETAIAGREQAVRLQQRLTQAGEADMMPATADLVESMNEAEFIQRFGGVDGAAYRQTLQTIERRIAELALFRD
ncbi:hypothetical protein A1507_19710 [Methylomonas koyamae]|uniref:Uncharacterized protein n=1 Tax=Methylomonas koyamae TaxID=702114 RepID=A0A177N1A8_9GAMM|nr:hypothetical protein [Methylomonas koyamae]OAI11757.1 hypothetical protein A1507_19710 [Methylomonas koyamae]